MCRWMSLLLVMAAACGLCPDSSSRLSGLGDGAGPDAAPHRTVHVHAPPGVEAAGSNVPLLYLEEGHALFFPQGASRPAHALVPGPGELVALGRRQDIVIITVGPEPSIQANTDHHATPEPSEQAATGPADPKPSAQAATPPDGWTRYITRLIPLALAP
ncbi:hypothetical protein [Pyxidicoccus trucidator]|uniref:hypothetical protein n=1 Tax=Pyxidicoccus trucidator TaxID=2709662 RepID=UPI001967B399|nr:hypothetical protein [Pyxidicoccus trucidator]